MLKFKIIDTIFIIITLITIILQKNINNWVIPVTVYIISFFIYFFISLIVAAVIESKYLGGYSKNLVFNIILVGVQLFLLGLLVCMIYRNIDLGRFKENSIKTVAQVSDIKRDIKFHRDTCSGLIRSGHQCCEAASDDCYYADDYYYVEYEYTLNYMVDNIEYSTLFELEDYKHYDSDAKAKTRSVPKYKINDTIAIYYNKNRPRDIRWSIDTIPNIIVYIFEIAIILIQVISLIKVKSLLKNI